VAALTSSVAPSLASEYAPTGAWLTQDVTNPTGKGPVSTGPVEPLDNPVDGTAPVSLNPSPLDWQEPEFAEQAPDYFYESAFPNAGPWPSLPEEGTGKEAFGTLPDDGITPIGSYKVPPKVEGFAQSKALLPGHDRHSQDVDSAGWEQYTASGRVAVRQGWAQHYPGVDNFWPVTQPNLSRTRVARGANQSIGGVVAQYGDLASSGGSTAYETPALPAVTPQQPAAAGASTVPQWGFS
jgi:hypothetical protein